MIATEKYYTDSQLLQLLKINKCPHTALLIEKDIILRQIDYEVNTYFTDYLLFSLLRVQKRILGRNHQNYKSLGFIQEMLIKVH